MKKNKTNLSEDPEVIVARNFEELETIRPAWTKLLDNESNPVVNADIDRYISIIKSKNGNAKPHVTLLRYNGTDQAMIIGRIENQKIDCKIGYKTLFRPNLKCLSIVYGGVIGKLTNENCKIIIRILMDRLAHGEADILSFNHIEIDSNLYKYAKSEPKILHRDLFTKANKHWTMDIPNSFGQFFGTLSAKHRSRLRRKSRKLEKKYPNKVVMRTYTKEDDLDEAIEASSIVSRTTYQYALGCGLKDTPSLRIMLSSAAKKGWLRLSVLFIDNEPSAFQVGLCYRNKYFLESLGFNPKWGNSNIGTMLFIKIFENLCNDEELKTFDFGFGHARYKKDYGNNNWDESSVYIFAPRMRTGLINLLYTATSGLSLGLNFVSDKIGFTRWIKRRWRNRLQGNTTK